MTDQEPEQPAPDAQQAQPDLDGDVEEGRRRHEGWMSGQRVVTGLTDAGRARVEAIRAGQALPTVDDFLDWDYSIGLWAGFLNFGCPFCPYAALIDNARMAEHVFDRHLAEPDTTRRIREETQA